MNYSRMGKIICQMCGARFHVACALLVLALWGSCSTVMAQCNSGSPPVTQTSGSSPDIFAVTRDHKLIRFNHATPGIIISSVPIPGVGGSEEIVAIDFRPSTGQLYVLAFDTFSEYSPPLRLSTINPTTGAATFVGGPFGYTEVNGFDFNPVTDRIRVDSIYYGNNLRVNPDSAEAVVDRKLAYAAGDRNAGREPIIPAAAHTNNFDGATETTLYVINTNLELVRQGSVGGTPISPDTGQLFTVGSLGGSEIGIGSDSFDIAAGSNTAYAALLSSGGMESKLYTINLTTGAATLVGTIGGGQPIRGIAVAPTELFYFDACDTPHGSVSESSGSVRFNVHRTGDTSIAATVDYVLDPSSTVVEGRDVIGTSGRLSFAPGEDVKSFTVFVSDDAYVEGDETLKIKLTRPTGGYFLDGSSAKLTITDNDTAQSATNPIDAARFFVREHYIDFLSREPEADGLNAWMGVLNRCPNVNDGPSCDRVEVSASFFRSAEFYLKGYFVYRFYRVSLGRLPHYAEMMSDMQSVTGQTGEEVTAKKRTFTDAWVQRQAFKDAYDQLSNAAYVETLLRPYNVTTITTTDPQTGAQVTVTWDSLVSDLEAGRQTRAQVLRAIVESQEVEAAEYNGAFVAMQYYGYLRRDPEAEGYNAWLRVINRGDGYRVMVNGFVNSIEYRSRFGQP